MAVKHKMQHFRSMGKHRHLIGYTNNQHISNKCDVTRLAHSRIKTIHLWLLFLKN